MSPFMELENVTVDIPIFDASRSFRQTLANRYVGGQIQKKKKKVYVRALHNISFRVEEGDRLGLIGHNGSGKTTLLRLLGGIYRTMIGRYTYHGKINPLFNMSIGMDLDDTGLENIQTIGTYLGMGRNEIAAKRDEIIAFSQLEDFIHLPVRTYSSGMMTRLSFAIATALDPDILLMDEGIGAGDTSFADKAKARLKTFYQRVGILVIASHADDLIRRLCNKAILLEHGKIIAAGNVEKVIKTYHGRM